MRTRNAMEAIVRYERNSLFNIQGNLLSIDILENEPFIIFKNPNYLKEEDIQISQSFQELCKFYAVNYNTSVKLEAELQKYNKEARNYNKDPEGLLSDRDVSPMDMFSYIKKLIYSQSLKDSNILFLLEFSEFSIKLLILDMLSIKILHINSLSLTRVK